MVTESIKAKPNQRQPNTENDNQTSLEPLQKRVFSDRFESVLAFIDGDPVSNVVIPYAEVLANSLNAKLQILTVLEADHKGDSQFDPVEWSMRRREAKYDLDRLVSEYRLDPTRTSIAILEGKSATAIGNCLSNSQTEILAFCRKDVLELGHIGSTSRTVLERCGASIFLVPARVSTRSISNYKRIMVPLDGSPRAESVLPVISGIAQSCKATVVIVHATPQNQLIEMLPGDSRSAQLKAELDSYNQMMAKQYLERVSRWLRESGISVELRVLDSGDARRRLIDAVSGLTIDLVVLSSHGASNNEDVPFGDVASHVMSRSPVPTLMLRGITGSDPASALVGSSKLSARVPESAGRQ